VTNAQNILVIAIAFLTQTLQAMIMFLPLKTSQVPDPTDTESVTPEATDTKSVTALRRRRGSTRSSRGLWASWAALPTATRIRASRASLTASSRFFSFLFLFFFFFLFSSFLCCLLFVSFNEKTMCSL